MENKREQSQNLGNNMGRPKLDLNKKAVKYAVAVREGKTKKEALKIAGYANTNAYGMVERQQAYLDAQKYFADEFKAKMSIGEVADALIDNIKQENESRIDRGARNRAIEIALERVEPQQKETTEERVLVVLAN